MNLKIYIRDSTYKIEESSAELFKLEGCKQHLEVEVLQGKRHRIDEVSNIDAFILHYAECSIEKIKQIRRENPSSLIIGISGGGSNQFHEEDRALFDVIYQKGVNTKGLVEETLFTLKRRPLSQ